MPAAIGTAPCTRCRRGGTGASTATFPQFGPPLAARGLLEAGDIEGCPYEIVAMRDLLRDVFAAVIANPSGTLRAGAQASARS